MNRKPVPTTATVPATTPATIAPTEAQPQVPQPQQPLSEWDDSPTAKKSFFSKPAFFSASGKQSTGTSIEKGADEVGTSSPRGGFFARNRKKKLILGGIGVALLLIFILGLGLGLGLKRKG
jgi:hypothetical protein